jgi:fibrillarin-like pre-rRNA processing protein
MEEINKFRIFRKRSGSKFAMFTQSLYRGYCGFSERIEKINGQEYREIKPDRSKFVAAIANGLSQTGIKEGSKVLYLGASHGYTASFVSDIVGNDGEVFCVDIAPRCLRDLVFVCEQRLNMVPILEDAFHTERYESLVGKVDAVFQDIAQRNQLEIFLKNCDAFLKSGGFGLLAIKARSIDVSKKPKEIFFAIRKELEKKMMIVDYRELDPHEKDHAFFVVKKK